MNPFVAANASRYARARPRYQGQVLETAARVLGLDRRAEWGVDVGCGTGHSSIALVALAKHVVAIDSAMTMLEVAEASGDIGYVVAAAERSTSSSTETCQLARHQIIFPSSTPFRPTGTQGLREVN